MRHITEKYCSLYNIHSWYHLLLGSIWLYALSWECSFRVFPIFLWILFLLPKLKVPKTPLTTLPSNYHYIFYFKIKFYIYCCNSSFIGCLTCLFCNQCYYFIGFKKICLSSTICVGFKFQIYFPYSTFSFLWVILQTGFT